MHNEALFSHFGNANLLRQLNISIVTQIHFRSNIVLIITNIMDDISTIYCHFTRHQLKLKK